MSGLPIGVAFADAAVYLVGGAVRDGLLGRPEGDRDWVVVGSSVEQMLAAGFRQVGRDFPVFLHPESQEEYALARTERKTGVGHLGFECHAGPEVTLEADLLRRDFTVNAIARDAEGALVDPHGGIADLRERRLRHVSGAFSEDPLRVLRGARFAAQLGFELAPETADLMRRMTAAGALQELAAERVWQEFRKALDGVAPARFTAVLATVGALDPWLPELAPAPSWYGNGALQRYAGLGAQRTPAAIDALNRRLRVPGAFARLASWLAVHADVLARWRQAPAEAVYDALQAAGALQRGARDWPMGWPCSGRQTG